MKNIVLVGLMGAGKTSVGKSLANELNFEFIDTDELIEKKEKRKISEIFATDGEEYFRNLECKICKEISKQSDTIISTGGGMVQNISNIDTFKANGYVVYLYASPEILYKRIKHEAHRPLLQNSSPLDTLEELLKTREKNYKLANLTINTENMSIDEIVKEIIKEYNENC